VEVLSVARRVVSWCCPTRRVRVYACSRQDTWTRGSGCGDLVPRAACVYVYACAINERSCTECTSNFVLHAGFPQRLMDFGNGVYEGGTPVGRSSPSLFSFLCSHLWDTSTAEMLQPRSQHSSAFPPSSKEFLSPSSSSFAPPFGTSTTKSSARMPNFAMDGGEAPPCRSALTALRQRVPRHGSGQRSDPN